MKNCSRWLATVGLALTLAAGAAHGAQPSSSLADYDFQPAHAPVGRVVHYVKSNLDGSRRAVLSMYFSEPLSIEVLKAEADGQFLALVQAELDPQTLSEAHMRSFNELESGAPRLQMLLDHDGPTGRLVARVGRALLPVRPGHWPTHLYNFDFNGLNATLPHLKDPRADFMIGVVDPDFDFLRHRLRRDQAGEQEGGFVDKGLARFRYLRDEVLDDVPCHRFEVGGPAFGGRTGTLWVNARDRLIERFEHPQPDHPEWSSFRLSRLSSQPMDDAAWEAFKAATVKRAMGLRDAD